MSESQKAKAIEVGDIMLQNLIADRDRWKARAEAFEKAINNQKPCWACNQTCDCFGQNECIETGKRFLRFNEARFGGGLA